MEGEGHAQGNGAARRRRRRTKPVGQKKKGHATKQSGNESSSSVLSDHSYASLSLPSDLELDVVLKSSGCDKAFDDIHVCLESGDTFSDTTDFCDTESELTSNTGSELIRTETDSEVGNASKNFGPKRIEKLNYQRQGTSHKHEASRSKDPDDDTIDIEGLANPDVDSATPSNDKPSTSAVCECEGGSNMGTQEKEVPDINEHDKAADKALCDNLKLMVPGHWMVDSHGQVVRVMSINDSKNARVVKCVSYDSKRGTVGVFVHGLAVPIHHQIYSVPKPAEEGNIGSISDYLSTLVLEADRKKLCPGISEYETLWKDFPGTEDWMPDQKPCYRSKNCLLLVSEKTSLCSECRFDAQKFKREQTRRESSRETLYKTSDKHLSREELILKKEKFKKKAKKEKQRADRLQKQNDDLHIKLDAALKDELTSILTENQHKMTEVQREFWKSQKAAMAINDKRGLRWHPILIRLALHLHSISPAAYDYFQETKILTLPSKRRLFDYAHFIEAKEGVQKEILEIISKKIQKNGPDEHFKYVNLMFDEMSIKAGLVTKNGELIGYTKLENVDKELLQLQAEMQKKEYKPRLAKKVLVYLVQGITSNVKNFVAIHSTDDLCASQLYDKTWNVIYFLESAGIKVLAVTCDGASINRRFINMHTPPEGLGPHQYTYCTRNLVSEEMRVVYFILDPPHLLKTIRNALANSFSHRKSRMLWKNGEFLSWKVIETLYEVTKRDTFRSHKLTKAHVTLSSFSCMNVKLATQVCSDSVGDAIENLTDHEQFQLLDTTELVKFIRNMNKFFDAVNAKERGEESGLAGEGCSNEKNLAYRDVNDPRLEWLLTDFLGYFDEWKANVNSRPGIFTKEERSRMIISHQALESLQITVRSIVDATRFMLTEANAPKVNPRVFNQDPVEQYFSQMRRKQGDNRNPSLDSVMTTSISMIAQAEAALPSKKGNTGAEKRKIFEVDSSPLPSRKKKPKDT